MSLDLKNDPGHVRRYSIGDRINHWITAVSFVLLAISGLSFFLPILFPLNDLFGGGSYARAIHPWLGVLLFVSFIGMFFRFWRLNLWVREDGLWMKNFLKVIKGEDESLPDLDKYNAGQKMVFWNMALLIPVLLVTGSIIWDRYFYSFTSIDIKRAAVLLHGLVAIGVITIWMAHVYAAYWVKGTFPAMLSGLVTSGWGYRHHRKWFRKEAELERTSSVSTPPGSPTK